MRKQVNKAPEDTEEVKLAKKKAINKFKKGLRTVVCPKCGTRVTKKWVTEIVSCGKCGYQKPKSSL